MIRTKHPKVAVASKNSMYLHVMSPARVLNVSSRVWPVLEVLATFRLWLWWARPITRRLIDLNARESWSLVKLIKQLATSAGSFMQSMAESSHQFPKKLIIESHYTLL